MRTKTLYTAVIAAALLIQVQEAVSCSFAVGFFYQVTHLRGNVVGMTNHWPLLGYGSYPGWLRHRVTRGNVRLHLHQYSWPIRNRSDARLIKAVVTDKDGRFDFGSVPDGHYMLGIDWPVADSNWFDVEVKQHGVDTAFVTIDVSPVDPDCKGGHTFTVRSQR